MKYIGRNYKWLIFVSTYLRSESWYLTKSFMSTSCLSKVRTFICHLFLKMQVSFLIIGTELQYKELYICCISTSCLPRQRLVSVVGKFLSRVSNRIASWYFAQSLSMEICNTYDSLGSVASTLSVCQYSFPIHGSMSVYLNLRILCSKTAMPFGIKMCYFCLEQLRLWWNGLWEFPLRNYSNILTQQSKWLSELN